MTAYLMTMVRVPIVRPIANPTKWQVHLVEGPLYSDSTVQAINGCQSEWFAQIRKKPLVSRNICLLSKCLVCNHLLMNIF